MPLRPWPDTLAAVEDLCTFFEQHGVRQLARTRIGIYRAVFEKFRLAAARDFKMARDDADDLIETLVEIEQLRTVMNAVAATRKPALWTRKVRELAKGLPFTSAEKDTASPRDTQFECFLAAAAALGSYSIRFEEPDILISGFDAEFSIAAKRLRSLNTLERRCRSAARQIVAAKVPGLVALDLTRALHPDWCLTPPTPEDALAIAEESLEGLLKDKEVLLRRWVGGRALGLVACIHLPAVIGSATSPQLMSIVAWRFVTWAEDRRGQEIIATFAKRCVEGLFEKNGNAKAPAA